MRSCVELCPILDTLTAYAFECQYFFSSSGRLLNTFKPRKAENYTKTNWQLMRDGLTSSEMIYSTPISRESANKQAGGLPEKQSYWRANCNLNGARITI